MARRTSNRKQNGGNQPERQTVRDLPTGMQVSVSSGGEIDEVEKMFERAYKNTMLYLKDGDEVNIAFLTMPQDFVRFGEHRVRSLIDNRYYLLPCAGNLCLVCEKFDDNYVTQCAHVPVYDYADGGVKLFRATPKVMKDILRHAKRRKKRFLTRRWTLAREGEELDTSYTFFNEDEKVGAEIDGVDVPDSQKILNDQLRLGITSVGLLADSGSGYSDDYDEDNDDANDDDYEDNDNDDLGDDDDDVESLLPPKRRQSR